jgi:ABC-type transport system involved in multi-copper enzyme maturation permease subunit
MPSGRVGILNLMRSEWTKLRTVKSTIWTLGIFVVLGIGLSALASAETAAHWSTTSIAQRASFDATRLSLIGVFFGQLVIGVLGVLVMSAEYGTGTIRSTFSAAPRRPLVLAAKVSVFGIVTFIVAEAVAFASYLLGQALLTAPAIHTTLGDPGAFRAVFAAGVYLFLLGLLAVALATIIRHTAGAISCFVGILLVLPLIVGALPSSIANVANKFLPADIGSAALSRIADPTQFGAWPGLAILAGYVVALFAIGTVMLQRRDA